MESALYSIWVINLRNLARNRIYILKGSGLQPSEYSNWPFYEYEFFLDDLNEYIEEENKRNEESGEKSDSIRSGYDSSKMMSEARKMMSSMKMPKY